MGFPVWHGLQFSLFLHILKKRDHASQLLSDRGLYAARVIVIDKAPKPLMQDVPNPHTTCAVSCQVTLYSKRAWPSRFVLLRGLNARARPLRPPARAARRSAGS